MKTKANFFAKNTLWVAKNLLGKYLCRRLPSGEVISAMITETEAYKGFRDKASHAHKGRTKRTEAMFGETGILIEPKNVKALADAILKISGDEEFGHKISANLKKAIAKGFSFENLIEKTEWIYKVC